MYWLQRQGVAVGGQSRRKGKAAKEIKVTTSVGQAEETEVTASVSENKGDHKRRPSKTK